MKQKMIEWMGVIFIAIVLIGTVVTKYKEWKAIRYSEQVEIITGLPYRELK